MKVQKGRRIKMDLKTKVKFARVRKNMSQEDLSKASGVGLVTISKIENGKSNTKNIRKSTLKCLCDALDIK